MNAEFSALDVRQVGVLLRGDADLIGHWTREPNPARTFLYVAGIIAGTGIYGASMGCWRDPMQACYTAIKFPLIILLTTLGNGLLNGMVAPLLGLNRRFRECLRAILISHAISAAILASFSPLIVFMVWNAKPMSRGEFVTYDFLQLTHIALIAFAGIVANLRLKSLLRNLGGAAVSRRVLCAWLAGNFLLGSQFTWILRPFFGAPGLPVEFIRKNALDGNFFESVFHTLRQILSS